MRPLKEIVIHCSATPEGRHHTAAEIRKWHKSRGWSDIGYHYVILLDGTLQKGRPLAQVGAHVASKNTGSIGVCYIGGTAKHSIKVPKDTRTAAQKKTMEALLQQLIKKYPTITKISGHDQYANKACPCFPAAQEYGHLVGRKVAAVRPASDPRYQYLQKLLARTGRDFGLVDGIKGERTQEAIKDFQQASGLAVNGAFDAPTVEALRYGWEDQKPVPKAVQKVIADANKTGLQSSTNKAAGFGAAASTVLAAKPVLDAVNEAKDSVSGILSAGPWVLLAFVGIGAGYYIWRERQRKAEAAQNALGEL